MINAKTLPHIVLFTILAGLIAPSSQAMFARNAARMLKPSYLKPVGRAGLMGCASYGSQAQAADDAKYVAPSGVTWDQWQARANSPDSKKQRCIQSLPHCGFPSEDDRARFVRLSYLSAQQLTEAEKDELGVLKARGWAGEEERQRFLKLEYLAGLKISEDEQAELEHLKQIASDINAHCSSGKL